MRTVVHAGGMKSLLSISLCPICVTDHQNPSSAAGASGRFFAFQRLLL